MTPEIEAARRIETARANMANGKPWYVNEDDAFAVARALLALVDAKDDLAELWGIAQSTHGPDEPGMTSQLATFSAAFNPTVAQRLIARVRAAEKPADPHEDDQVTQQQRGEGA